MVKEVLAIVHYWLHSVQYISCQIGLVIIIIIIIIILAFIFWLPIYLEIPLSTDMV
ncbi:hypothetical protein [Spirulina sp. 06S082]|uniref:hypothetical protein n=1 Tax=Spirulina sp. 06S082 TaxID=3110248 RepID=UPI002B2157B2|nr:hypothetical protein [Spirulina sp. 06S082]MEA5471352.1 hypothetical protein [Spirulina sp. 06S082]